MSEASNKVFLLSHICFPDTEVCRSTDCSAGLVIVEFQITETILFAEFNCAQMLPIICK